MFYITTFPTSCYFINFHNIASLLLKCFRSVSIVSYVFKGGIYPHPKSSQEFKIGLNLKSGDHRVTQRREFYCWSNFAIAYHNRFES